ncbi:MAG: hypothetical protein ACFFA3_00245 [Promethearchaeota archaeon]
MVNIEIDVVNKPTNRFRIEQYFGTPVANEIFQCLQQHIGLSASQAEAQLRASIQRTANAIAKEDEIITIMGFITVG